MTALIIVIMLKMVGDHVHDDKSHGNEMEQSLNDEPVTVKLRRSLRVPKPSTRYSSSKYVMLTNSGEP